MTKPSTLIADSAAVSVRSDTAFVSRGGDKLEGALVALAVPVVDAVVVDVGASTGGFTDCVLRRGARKVYAVDVGNAQLDARLRDDARVVARDGVNARHLRAADFAEPIDVVVVDASFISLGKLAPALFDVVRPGGRLVALVKPQFEVGREAARRSRGVVRDPEERERAIARAAAAIAAVGFRVEGTCDSAVPGPKGNLECFLHATKP